MAKKDKNGNWIMTPGPGGDDTPDGSSGNVAGLIVIYAGVGLCMCFIIGILVWLFG